ncbi:TIGR03620 family F420-dependent LLM class oxidoreductase [Kribbella qitaiheensis]|uniref:TIGR03620 family F420-dependent LLM class oxidoreductase n=1 Tax=Kribbella qitaiheensis TaxID=1544730 RepID=A0A7G6X1T7_9ACTN|nr:TIGR03620 family F420-dependent LLM class oxidoreductase [Kribbella qitaiheensis]QNE20202.1 TIGR03620 family F420-dependent LLM class oxidoreductase [Kribbella qitaiheensis]
MTNLALGPIGIATGLNSSPESLAAAAAAEDLGYPAIWLSGGPLPGLQTIVDLVGATNSIQFISGILAVDTYTADDVAATYEQLEASDPGRFTVGLGGAHGPKPLATLNAYLDQLTAVPTERRLLAALGPRMLELARDRSEGVYPFLITPSYAAEARQLLGPDKLLAVNHLVVLETDPARARSIARNTISFFTTIPSYAASLKRQGFSDSDLADLPDAMVDTLAAWGAPDAIAAKLQEHHAAGVDHVAINVITGVTGPQPIAEWQTLAPTLLAL